jgi:hypothetical protein
MKYSLQLGNRVAHKVLTYVEYRAVSGVFQNIDPPTPLSHSPVPEFIDPVFAKTSPKRAFSMAENERFGVVFAKTGSINSGTGVEGGGGSIFWKTPDIGLASYSIISLWGGALIRTPQPFSTETVFKTNMVYGTLCRS